jgi:hypothetical protein
VDDGLGHCNDGEGRGFSPHTRPIESRLLRVGIHQQHLETPLGQSPGNIDGEGGLPYPALLIQKCYTHENSLKIVFPYNRKTLSEQILFAVFPWKRFCDFIDLRFTLSTDFFISASTEYRISVFQEILFYGLLLNEIYDFATARFYDHYRHCIRICAFTLNRFSVSAQIFFSATLCFRFSVFPYFRVLGPIKPRTHPAYPVRFSLITLLRLTSVQGFKSPG